MTTTNVETLEGHMDTRGLNDMNSTNVSTPNKPNMIGGTVKLQFPSLSDRIIAAKVDTGATNSSLHATNINPNSDNTSVSFVCPCLSDNSITMELDGTQEVVSADAGGQTRPMVKMHITVNGVDLPNISFNLNDRSEMDSPILIGQNILKAGDFVIDVNMGEDEPSVTEGEEKTKKTDKKEDSEKQNEIMEAIKVLKRHNVSIFDLVEFLRTAPLYLRINIDEKSK